MQMTDGNNLTPHQVSNLEMHAKQLTDRLTEASLETQRTTLIDLVQSIHISSSQMTLKLRRRLLMPENTPALVESEDDLITLNYPLQMKRRGVETKLIIGGQAVGGSDPDLINLIAKAKDWYEGLKNGTHPTIGSIAKTQNVDRSDISRTLMLAFLAPSIVKDFINGKHPADLTVDQLRRLSPNLPLDWNSQRAFLGMQG
jgi:hypothetical protein